MSCPPLLRPRWPLLLLLAAIANGCGGGLTREEAKAALDEIELASQSQALTANGIELTTQFTIGEAVETAAEELRAFVSSQLPCADVSVSVEDGEATITIEYGALSGACSYRGHTLTGTHELVIRRNDPARVLVEHVWTDLGNGKMLVNGTADVEWNLEDRFRHVVHEAEWTRIADGRTGTGTGDRVQRPLAAGLTEGFSVDGERHWQGQRGNWGLVIDDVEMRWIDPVPQAGSYRLATPFDKEVVLQFERTGDTTIRVTVTGPRRSFDFTVRTAADGRAEIAESGDAG